MPVISKNLLNNSASKAAKLTASALLVTGIKAEQSQSTGEAVIRNPLFMIAGATILPSIAGIIVGSCVAEGSPLAGTFGIVVGAVITGTFTAAVVTAFAWTPVASAALITVGAGFGAARGYRAATSGPMYQPARNWVRSYCF